jgi:sulfate adenylyltransferase subunit 1
VTILPSGFRSTIARIDTYDGQLEAAHTGQSVTLILADERDASRGDVIVATAAQPRLSDEFPATLCWLADKPLTPGARVLIKHGAATVQGFVVELLSQFNEQDLSSSAAPETLSLNEIGQATIRVAQELPIDDYVDSRSTGSFLVIDPKDGTTLAAGLIGANLPWQRHNT